MSTSSKFRGDKNMKRMGLDRSFSKNPQALQGRYIDIITVVTMNIWCVILLRVSPAKKVTRPNTFFT